VNKQPAISILSKSYLEKLLTNLFIIREDGTKIAEMDLFRDAGRCTMTAFVSEIQESLASTLLITIIQLRQRK